MNNTEQIRAEIKRLRSQAEWEKNKAEGISHDGYCMHMAEEYLCLLILDFLDSLEQEPQGLDEAAEEYSDNTWFDVTDEHGRRQVAAPNIAKESFKAGAKWQATQSTKLIDNINEDTIRNAAIYNADKLFNEPKDYALAARADYWHGAYEGFKAGAKYVLNHK